MGSYLNPGQDGYQINLNSSVFVDKTEIIAELNGIIKTDERYICISRPRRFGKSVTVKMLLAYYSKNEDSDALFRQLKISGDISHKKHLNRYDTVFINMTDEFNFASRDIGQMICNITKCIVTELRQTYQDVSFLNEENLALCLNSIYKNTKIPFVIVIDEWDAIMREKPTDEDGIRAYLEWLKLIFKDKDYVALAYMTGILPLKKDGSQSAISEVSSSTLSRYMSFPRH